MKYFSMFTGIGGFELGIKQAYENYNLGRITKTSNTEDRWNMPLSTVSDGNGRRTHADCIGFSEIDKYASQLLQIKFPEVKNYGDATKIDEHQLPDFDLLVGGFPCQSFSIAGKRKGFDDTRGTLFFDIARILAYKKPKHLLLENVKGLLSHDGGRTFQTIIGVLTDLGYFVEWQVLNSKNFGVPQNRERVFIIGYLGGQPRQKVFPVGESNARVNESNGTTTQTNIAPTIDSRVGATTHRSPYIEIVNKTKKNSQGYRVRTTNGVSVTLAGQAGRLGAKTGLYQIEDMKIRRLTPLECERLQGFPDNWTKDFSDTQRYKMCGNAVTVNVVEFLIKRLYE